MTHSPRSSGNREGPASFVGLLLFLTRDDLAAYLLFVLQITLPFSAPNRLHPGNSVISNWPHARVSALCSGPGHRAVLALAFGDVHGLIGMMKQLQRIARVVGSQCKANAGANGIT